MESDWDDVDKVRLMALSKIASQRGPVEKQSINTTGNKPSRFCHRKGLTLSQAACHSASNSTSALATRLYSRMTRLLSLLAMSARFLAKRCMGTSMRRSSWRAHMMLPA